MIKWLLKRYYKQELNIMWEIVKNKDQQIENLRNQIITMQGTQLFNERKYR